MFDERRQRFTVALNFLDTVATVALYLLAIWAGSLWSGEGSFVDQISLLPTVVAMLLVFLPYWGAYRGLGTTALSFYVAAICKAVALSIAALFTLIFFSKLKALAVSGLACSCVWRLPAWLPCAFWSPLSCATTGLGR